MAPMNNDHVIAKTMDGEVPPDQIFCAHVLHTVMRPLKVPVRAMTVSESGSL
jgi:hypothetical protein